MKVMDKMLEKAGVNQESQELTEVSQVRFFFFSMVFKRLMTREIKFVFVPLKHPAGFIAPYYK